MTEETYEQHKQTLADGKIVSSQGRTAATLEQLDTLRQIEAAAIFGKADPQEVMAIHSGRITPEAIAEMGPEHPLIVAAHRLTEDQLDALAQHIAAPFMAEVDAANAGADAANAKADTLQQSLSDLQAKIAEVKPPKTQSPPSVPSSAAKSPGDKAASDPSAQVVQAQLASGATDNLTPKTVLDNKTNSVEMAGKDASKTKADAVQSEEKEGAKSAA